MEAATPDDPKMGYRSFKEELSVIYAVLSRVEAAHVAELEELRREYSTLRRQFSPVTSDEEALSSAPQQNYSNEECRSALEPLHIVPQDSTQHTDEALQPVAKETSGSKRVSFQLRGAKEDQCLSRQCSGTGKPPIQVRDVWLDVGRHLVDSNSLQASFKVFYKDETSVAGFRLRTGSFREGTVRIQCKIIIELFCSVTTLHPVGVTRLIWNALSLGFIFYDLLILPLQAFHIEEQSFVQICDWIVAIFWTVDVFVTLRTGYFVGARLEMRHRQIAIHYARTWLSCDVLVIVVEWVSLLAQRLGSASILRSSRTLRSLRFLRLARVTKLRHFFQGMFDILNSNVHILVFTLMGLSVVLLLACHFVTCIWYALGSDSSDGWVTYEPLMDKSDIFFWYIASARWVIAQLNGRTDIDEKRNLRERFFTCVVGVMFAFICRAMFVSFITKTMLDLSEIFSEKARLQRLVNQYLASNQLPQDLSSRVKRCLHEYHDIRHEAKKEEKVLAVLPRGVQSDVLYEIRAPVVTRHFFYNSLHFESPSAMRSICRAVVQTVSARKGEILFRQGDACTRMLFTDKLIANYSQCFDDAAVPWSESAVLPSPASGLSSSISISSKSTKRSSWSGSECSSLQAYAADQLVKQVSQDSWICEAALWTEWVNRGSFTTLTHGFLYGIQPADLAQALLKHSNLFVMANMYAQCVVGELQCQENMSDILPFEVQFVAPIKLKVTVVSASNLRNADISVLTGYSDPYCVCKAIGLSGTCSEKRFRTPTIGNKLDPVWNHSAEVGLHRHQSLRFEVWDSDVPRPDTLLGEAVIDASEFYPCGFEGFLDLVGVDKAQGSLKVKIEVLQLA